MPENRPPFKFQRRKKLLLVLLYLATAYAGVSALVWTPVTISSPTSVGFTLAWASVLVVMSVTAIFGVIRRNTAVVEQVSVWFLSIGVLGYITTLWLLVGGTPTRQAQAALCTGLLIALVNRAFDIGVVASRQRSSLPGLTSKDRK